MNRSRETYTRSTRVKEEMKPFVTIWAFVCLYICQNWRWQKENRRALNSRQMITLEYLFCQSSPLCCGTFSVLLFSLTELSLYRIQSAVCPFLFVVCEPVEYSWWVETSSCVVTGTLSSRSRDVVWLIAWLLKLQLSMTQLGGVESWELGRGSEGSLHYKKLPSDSLLLFHSRKHSEIDDDDELPKPA